MFIWTHSFCFITLPASSNHLLICLQISMLWCTSQIFWEVIGLEQGPLRLVSKTEELLGRKNCGSGLETREYCCRDPLRWPHDTLYPQKLELTSLTRDGRSVDDSNHGFFLDVPAALQNPGQDLEWNETKRNVVL
jgi:hypothetical protein